MGKQHPQEVRRFWSEQEGLNIQCGSLTPKIPATLLARREKWGGDPESKSFLKTLSQFSCSLPH